MTRWHVDDPAGRLIERFGDRVTIARYPAIAEHDEKYRKKGEALFPKLKSIDFLMERRKLYTEARGKRSTSNRRSSSAVASFRSRSSPQHAQCTAKILEALD